MGLHVLERVDCKNWKVFSRLAQVFQRVCKFVSIGQQSIDGGFLVVEFAQH